MQIGFEEGRWALCSSQSPTEEGTPQGGLLPWAKNFLSSRQNPDVGRFPSLADSGASRWNVALVGAGFSPSSSLPSHHLQPLCACSRGHTDTHTHMHAQLPIHVHACTHRDQTYRRLHTHARKHNTHTSLCGCSCNLVAQVAPLCSHSLALPLVVLVSWRAKRPLSLQTLAPLPPCQDVRVSSVP